MKAWPALFAFALSALGQPAMAQGQPAVDSFAVYQTCFNKAATELFGTGVTQAAKLEKAARKRCKAEREQAIIDTTVQFLLDAKSTSLTKADRLREMERAVAQPVMKRLGFEGY